MTLYLIGLGLNLKGISTEGKEILEKCEKIYLENYTVNFPYAIEDLKKELDQEILQADRTLVESKTLIDQAKEKEVALLIYGSPLTATTHISLIEDAKKENIDYKIIYGTSIFDAIAETGLQIYKFGKITSMPKWTKNYTPTSFLEIIKENQTIEAHSLILIDIGLEISDAIKQLEKSFEEKNMEVEKIIICSKMGTSQKKILYKKISELKDIEITKPYCIVIPSKLHYIEEEALEGV